MNYIKIFVQFSAKLENANPDTEETGNYINDLTEDLTNNENMGKKRYQISNDYLREIVYTSAKDGMPILLYGYLCGVNPKTQNIIINQVRDAIITGNFSNIPFSSSSVMCLCTLSTLLPLSANCASSRTYF